MSQLHSAQELSGLPLPVAVLARRARNAKSAKERHDSAWYAWEASVRLIAAMGPKDPTRLIRPSMGHWVGAIDAPQERSEAIEVLSLYALLTEVGAGKASGAQSVTPRKFLDALPPYRNHVLGHGSVRQNRFYDDAADKLLMGLYASWSSGFLAPADIDWLYVESVEIDPSGTRRGRALSMKGLASTLITSGIDLPAEALPGQVWFRTASALKPLAPWIVVQSDDLSERVYFFNAWKRSGTYLDFASGETVRGDAVDLICPGTQEALRQALSAESRPGDAEEVEEEGPDQFGEYQVLGKLGEGGMGVVYLARQGTLGRIVALKMLPPGLAEDKVAIARFRREIATLSRCDHPNIVKILAAGQARGTWYYAMEYVPGADLAQVASHLPSVPDLTTAVTAASRQVREERHALFEHLPNLFPEESPALDTGRNRHRQLAELFRDAADGLQHLHDNGILHRDLKPGNLMVTASDGRVVIMDLGLAAVQDASRSLTRDAHSLLGTLRYMAPEQLQRNLVSIDRRADVFGLGATFFELFTGRPVRDGDTEARLVEQALRDRPPTARSIDRSVPEDIEVILGKTLEPDPRARYDDARAVASDLEAFLDGRPIAARPPTLWYVLQLASRRNPALAGMVGLALALFLAGSVAVTGLWIQAEQARAEAVEAQVQSRAVTNFLRQVFLEADPGRAMDAELTAEDLLIAAYARMETDLLDQPEVRIEVLGILGHVLKEIGKNPFLAIEPFEEGIALAEAEGVADDESVLYNMRNNYAGTLQQVGRRKEALELYQQLIDQDVGDARFKVALRVNSGLACMPDWEEAIRWTEEAIALADATLEPEVSNRLNALSNLGLYLRESGRPEEALVPLREVYELRSKTVEPDHPSLQQTRVNLGAALGALGEYEEAETLLRAAVASYAKVRGPLHLATRQTADLLFRMLGQQGRIAEAEVLLRDLIAQALAAPSPSQGDIWEGALLLHQLLKGQGRVAEGVEILLAHRVHLDSYAKTDRRYHVGYFHLAHELEQAGRLEEALQPWQEAAQTCVNLASEANEYARNCAFEAWARVGRIHGFASRHAEALQALERAAALANEAAPDGHVKRIEIHINLGLTRYALEDLEGALTAFAEARRQVKLSTNPPTRSHRVAMQGVAGTLTALGRREEGLAAFAEAHEWLQTRNFPPEEMEQFVAAWDDAKAN